MALVVKVLERSNFMLTSNNKLRLNFAKVREEIKRSGFAFVTGAEITATITSGGVVSHWNILADSWNNLGLDRYMADGGRYQRRRIAVLEFHWEVLVVNRTSRTTKAEITIG